MEPFAAFAVLLVFLLLGVIPVVSVVLLAILVRRQHETRWDLEEIKSDLLHLKRLAAPGAPEQSVGRLSEPAGSASPSQPHPSPSGTPRPGTPPLGGTDSRPTAGYAGSPAGRLSEPAGSASPGQAYPSPSGPPCPPAPPLGGTDSRPTVGYAGSPAGRLSEPAGGASPGQAYPSPSGTPRPPTPPLGGTDSRHPAGTARPPGLPAPGLEAASKTLLHKLWNWFLFGAESLPQGASLEYAIATNWLLRAGILIVVLGMGFFLKYSMERNYIGPVARCVLSVLAGLGMTGVGTKLTGRRYHLLGLGLVGGGLVVLYWSVYAITVFYDVLSQAWALPMMVVVTVGAGVLALRLKSPLVAIIGLVGGYGCPILMRVHDADVIGIMLYMLVLGAGVLAISFWRNWHLLNYLGFIFNYGIVFSLHRHFTASLFWPLMGFLALFFGLYAAAMQMHSFARRQKSTLIEMAGQALNSAFFFGLAGGLVRDNFAREWVALVALGLAAFFLLHVLAFIARGLTDKGLLVVLMGLGAFYLTISMPIMLSDDWLTVAWAMQALIMLWAARRLGSSFLRNLAYAVYAIAMTRVMTWDIGREFAGRGAAQSPGEYWHALGGRITVFAATILSLFGGCWLHRQEPLAGRLPDGAESDLPAAPPAAGSGVFFWGAILFSFLYLNLECNRFYLAVYDPLRPAGLTLLWVALCAWLAWRVAKGDSAVALPLLCLSGIGLGAKILFFDLPFWEFDMEDFVCGNGAYSFLDASFRALDFALVIGLLFGVFAFSGAAARGDRAALRATFGYLGVGVLFLYLTLEVNSALTIFKEGFRAGAVSILWSLFAFVFVVCGLRRDRQALRFVGLALFAVVVAKVFMVDLMQLDPLYRIIAFIALGIVVTGGSFVYLFFRSAQAVPETGDDR